MVMWSYINRFPKDLQSKTSHPIVMFETCLYKSDKVKKMSIYIVIKIVIKVLVVIRLYSLVLKSIIIKQNMHF